MLQAACMYLTTIRLNQLSLPTSGFAHSLLSIWKYPFCLAPLAENPLWSLRKESKEHIFQDFLLFSIQNMRVELSSVLMAEFSLFTCKMGTIILTLSISVRIKLYMISTSVGEFLACISGVFLCFYLFFFWSVLFSNWPPTTTELSSPAKASSQSALPSEISFVQPLFILYSKLASHPFLSSTDELPHRLACCSRHIYSVVYIPLSSLPGTSPSQSLPFSYFSNLSLSQPIGNYCFYPFSWQHLTKGYISHFYLWPSVSVKDNII